MRLGFNLKTLHSQGQSGKMSKNECPKSCQKLAKECNVFQKQHIPLTHIQLLQWPLKK